MRSRVKTSYDAVQAFYDGAAASPGSDLQEDGTGNPDWRGDGTPAPVTFEDASEVLQEDDTGAPDEPDGGSRRRG